ncbi:MAG: hypothetical protein LCH39_08045 [Proteobacteria bacterium]|nr:hypothetical protein [Pseudomonadota bacterium]
MSTARGVPSLRFSQAIVLMKVFITMMEGAAENAGQALPGGGKIVPVWLPLLNRSVRTSFHRGLAA